MTDRPMIFSAPMIRALLDGRKTQTRRVLKPQPIAKPTHFVRVATRVRDGRVAWEAHDQRGPISVAFPGPPGCVESLAFTIAPGDRLWVRETWSASGTGLWTIADARARIASDQRIIYAADGGEGPWWSSIRLPREFSRLTLVVTDVRVQRLREIDAADVTAEGIPTAPRSAIDFATGEYSPGYEMPNGGFSNLPGAHKTAYARLWERLHGEGAWAANPWVAALTFRVIRANIDAPEARAA